MTDITPFLRSLLDLPGLSGYEKPASEMITKQWQPLVDEITTSTLGSLHGVRKAHGSTKAPRIMIATHMDAIGMMVTKIDQGLLRFTQVGGVDPRILPGQAVIVHGRRELPGIVQLIPDRLLDSHSAGNAPDYKYLFVDVGLPEKQIVKLIQPGDLISFAQKSFEMDGGYVAGHSLDNRASVAALTICLEELQNIELAWDVYAVATIKEEESGLGALTSAYAIRPDIAVTIDVTFAKGPGSTDYRSFPLGKGPSIGVGANIHPVLVTEFTKLAKEMDLPYGMEMMAKSSGTDSMMMQITAEGIPNMVLGIPIRYMHTSVELVSVSDIYRTGKLLARFISQLKSDSTKTLFEKFANE
jgi:putative aminopeptidase FrvX